MAVTRSSAKASKPRKTSNEHAATSKKSGERDGPEKTPDGHYIIVNGRRWRATDPLIPEIVLQELKHYLSKGRTGVRNMKGRGKTEADEDIKLSRTRTGLAKLGLGERGQPEWWCDTEEGRKKRWENVLAQLRLLDVDPPEAAASDGS